MSDRPLPARRAFLIGLPVLLVSGCAVLGPMPDPPRVSIAAMDFVEAGILEQRFKMKLRVQNPSTAELAVSGADVRVELNGKLFITGLGHDAVTIPALGTATFDIDAFSTLSGIVRQLNALTQGERKSLSYRMRGVLFIGTSQRRVAFEDAGEVDWPAAAQAG